MVERIKLLVGLANPGRRYVGTRHNVGAGVVQALARLGNIQLKEEARFFGMVGKTLVADQNIHLLIPTTYMNLSGKAVSTLARFYRIEPEEIAVVHDEFNLAPGAARLKRGGGQGGHNGLKDVIEKLGGNRDFLRIKIGIGRPPPGDAVAFVLGKPSRLDRDRIDRVICESVHCLNILLRDNLTKAQSQLHSFRTE